MVPDAFAMVEKPDLGLVFQRAMPVFKRAAGQLIVGGLALATFYWGLTFVSAGIGLTLSALVSAPLICGMLTCAYQAANDEPVDWMGLLAGFKMPHAYLLGVITTVALFTGFLFLILPGLYLMFALVYTKCFVVSRQRTAFEAFRDSIKLFNANLGFSLLIALVGWILYSVGNAAWVLAALCTPVMVVLHMVTFELLLKLPKNADLR